MKHVLIPTDFTIASLQTVHAAMVQFPNEPIRISLLHLLEMPTGIGDLLMRAVRKDPNHLITADFQKACEIIKNKYGNKIAQMDILFRYGNTKNYVQNLLEGLSVDAIVLDPEFKWSLPHNSSVPMTPLLRKSGYHIIEMAPALKAKAPGHISFGSLLLKEMPETSLSGA